MRKYRLMFLNGDRKSSRLWWMWPNDTWSADNIDQYADELIKDFRVFILEIIQLLETTLPTLLSYDSTIYNVDTSNGIVLYGYGELETCT